MQEELELKGLQGGAYELYAVIDHHGAGPGTGHYTCSVMIDGVWYMCDDDMVLCEPRTPSSSTAYLLFYRLNQEF